MTTNFHTAIPYQAEATSAMFNDRLSDLDDALSGVTPLTNVDINGGAIDGTPIGATTPSTLRGTDLTISGTTTGVNISATNVTSGTFDNARINWASPSAIGATTANTGRFTDLTVTGSTTGVNIGASNVTSGTLTHERGGLEADVSAYSGLVKISGGVTSQAVGGTDYANASHTHNATDINAGTLNASRLPTSGVTAGSYTSANLTVDTYGRITTASNGGGSVNAWTANTNTNVTITGSTSDIFTGLSIALTPNKGSVMCLFFAEDGGYSSADINFGYKVNSGAITYSTQDTAQQTRLNLYTITGLTIGASNTITFYVKKNNAGNATLYSARAILWEMQN